MESMEIKIRNTNYMEFIAITNGERYGNGKQALMIMWVNKWYVWWC